MDRGAFDTLARTVAGAEPRRVLLRLLVGGALTCLTSQFGLGEGVGAKKRRRRDKHEERGHLRRESKGKQRKKRKTNGKKRKRKPTPPKPVSCASGCEENGGRCCPDGSCVISGRECCANEKTCGDSIVTCISPNQCCPEQRKCQDGSCLDPYFCCPEQRTCETQCLPLDQCCRGERFCGDLCISENECCELDPAPLCGECEAPACDNGTWECRIAEGYRRCADGSCVTTDACCFEDPAPTCTPAHLQEVACCHGEKICRVRYETPACWEGYPGAEFLNWNPETCRCECPAGFVMGQAGIYCCPTSHPYQHSGGHCSGGGKTTCALGFGKHDPQYPNICVPDPN